jgi:hypothetical protein
MFVDV